MLKLNRADPTRRTPTYLQNNTQENLVWQLKLTAAGLLCFWGKSWYDDRKLKKARNKIPAR